MSPIDLPQVRRLMFNDERIGMGFNSDTGLAVGSALEGFTEGPDPTAPGQEVFSTISEVTSHDELMETIGMSVELQGRYGFFSGSVKAEFSESTKYNSTSTFLVARCIVKNAFRRGTGFRLTQAAHDVLNVPGSGPDQFKHAFGDSFVRGLETGGEFYAVLRVTSISTVKEKELAASLQAEYNGLVTEVGFEAKFREANQEARTRSEFQAIMYQKAGTSAEISPTTKISEILDRVKRFPAIVEAHPVAYETEVASYDTLPLPLDTPVEQEDFRIALDDAKDRKLRYVQTRNDLQFAREHSEFFEDLPPDAELAGAIAVYTRLLNAVIRHGEELAGGRMRPPQVFDPGALQPPIVEPAPIPLKRTTVPVEQVRIPDMLDFINTDIAAALSCLSVGTVEECLNGVPGVLLPVHISDLAMNFLAAVRKPPFTLTINPPGVLADPSPFVLSEQSPQAGTVLAPGSEVILTFVPQPGA
jgi:hypothetical protein